MASIEDFPACYVKYAEIVSWQKMSGNKCPAISYVEDRKEKPFDRHSIISKNFSHIPDF